MRESYEFMRMPCQFKGAPINEEYVPMQRQYDNCNIMPFPAETPVGMAYVPYQQWNDMYTADDGFMRGTMFPELDYPFKGGDCGCE